MSLIVRRRRRKCHAKQEGLNLNIMNIKNKVDNGVLTSIYSYVSYFLCSRNGMMNKVYFSHIKKNKVTGRE